MGIISYAQNFEDVMLWRALKDIENGCYIDIGANDPTKYSVTKAFYENGWSGLNFEPVAHWFNKLEEERPRDTNLQIAIGKDSEKLEFFEVVGTGLSTLDKEIAHEHAEKLGFEIKSYFVDSKTLTDVYKEKNLDTVHFLKIDVEGAEKIVLQGIDFEIVRPWIVVIEATQPMSQDVNYEEWQELIVSNQYHFVYFDGLNRFYIADEHSELDQYFTIPPNVFDSIVLCEDHHQSILSQNKIAEAEEKASLAEEKASLAEEKASLAEEKASLAEERASLAEERVTQAEERVTQAEERVTQAEERVTQAEERVTQAEERANDALHQYPMVVHSNSWKMTKPLRIAGKSVRWFATGVKHWVTFSPTSRPRRVVKKVLLTSKHSINAHPKIKMKLMEMLEHFPVLKERLRKVGKEEFSTTPVATTHCPHTPSQLSPQAQKIYDDLKQAIALQQGSK